MFFDLLGIATGSHWGASLEFFIYDTVKILLLLMALIYAIAWIRASLNVELVRDYLMGKRRGFGYFLGVLFGGCHSILFLLKSIPLFLGFTTARIPLAIAITMSFLITSPLVPQCEIAVVFCYGVCLAGSSR